MFLSAINCCNVRTKFMILYFNLLKSMNIRIVEMVNFRIFSIVGQQNGVENVANEWRL